MIYYDPKITNFVPIKNSGPKITNVPKITYHVAKITDFVIKIKKYVTKIMTKK